MSSRLATLTELDTTLSVEDAWNLLEIARVDAHNRAVVRAAQKREE